MYLTYVFAVALSTSIVAGAAVPKNQTSVRSPYDVEGPLDLGTFYMPGFDDEEDEISALQRRKDSPWNFRARDCRKVWIHNKQPLYNYGTAHKGQSADCTLNHHCEHNPFWCKHHSLKTFKKLKMEMWGPDEGECEELREEAEARAKEDANGCSAQQIFNCYSSTKRWLGI